MGTAITKTCSLTCPGTYSNVTFERRGEATSL